MYGIGSRFLASSAPSSLSVKHIEREIRNKCRKGELLPAMEAIRQLLNNDKTPSQDCLGNILHYCQVPVDLTVIVCLLLSVNCIGNRSN